MLLCVTKVSYWGLKHIHCLHISKSSFFINFWKSMPKACSSESHPSVMSQGELLPLTGSWPQQSVWAARCKQTVGFFFLPPKLSNRRLANLKNELWHWRDTYRQLWNHFSHDRKGLWQGQQHLGNEVMSLKPLSHSTTCFHPDVQKARRGSPSDGTLFTGGCKPGSRVKEPLKSARTLTTLYRD